MNELKFIQVGELAKGISENLLPDSDALSGRSLDLFFENGTKTVLRFESGHDLSWKTTGGSGKGSGGRETYQATSIRDGIFFLDYISSGPRPISNSIIVDLNSKSATSVVGSLPVEQETKKDIFSRATEGVELTSVKG